ncbi:MAG: hypothetical protein PHE29_13495 [Tissierellia bacterium]|nr:hypothetical protein [Tissierellia bacterium]
MENLDIKEGDYVETKDGLKGYVYSKYPIIGGNCEMGCYFYDIMVNDLYYGKFAEKEMEQNFARIGKYDFTKKDKIEPLPYTQSFIEEIRSNNIIISKYSCEKQTDNKMIIDKINEIIDKVNKIGE